MESALLPTIPGAEIVGFLTGRLGRDLPTAAILATVLALFTRTFVVLPVHVPTESMAPTLLPGDHVLTHRPFFGTPSRGEVLMIRSTEPGARYLVKRCIGLPGETLEIHPGGQIDVDGHRLIEPYAAKAEPPTSEPLVLELGADEYFVLGDNRPYSRDSRHWGPVSRSRILGRAMMVYWSVEPADRPIGDSGRWDKISAHSRDGWANTRWDRLFRWVR